MGRTSKFSFPYPGRKRSSNDAKNKPDFPVGAGQNTSKAQKILGTGGALNIDSPVRDDSGSWRSFSRSPSSSAMSVAISESTMEDDLSLVSNSSAWDREPSVQLHGKASSTLLGRRYQEDVITDNSSTRRKLHTERSTSTLRSYYDRSSTPLSVSQQTSASSVRDLALRKGFPPVTQNVRSPLLEVDCIEPKEALFESQRSDKSQSGQSSRKKPARLDLTKLFPKPRKDGGALLGQGHLTRSPSAISMASTDTKRSDGSRKLTKSDSKSKQPKPVYNEPQASTPRRTKKDRLSDVYEDRESTPRDPSRQTSINASSEVEKPPRLPPRGQPPTLSHMQELESQQRILSEEQYAMASLASPRWDTRSFTSTSSHNTKGSRHTSASVMSNSDLRNNSVLSISSSDEDSDEEAYVPEARNTNQDVRKSNPQSTGKSSRPPSSMSDLTSKGLPTKVNLSTKYPRAQDGNFLTIPLPPLTGSRLSGPWNPKPSPNKRQSSASSRSDAAPISPVEPVVSGSTQRPGSQNIKTITGRNSRLMAVTKQEEALLEALRQKRARMKETIIAEHNHEIAKSPSPPRIPVSRHVPRDSASSFATVRPEKRNDTQRVLLYLDAPESYGRDIDTAEPSPDLSDFLSFGSDDDEDSTPRTSWMVSKDRGRADSITTPGSDLRDSPKTPQSAARLSAVGGLDGLVGETRGDGRKAVAFMGNVNRGSPDYLEEIDVVWGL